MCNPPLGRRVVAIIAAYALALHALLSTFVTPLQAAPSGLSFVCFGAGAANDREGGPPPHDPACIVCATSGCAVAPPIDADVYVAVIVELASRSVEPRPRRAAETEPAGARAQSPRAPPLIG